MFDISVPHVVLLGFPIASLSRSICVSKNELSTKSDISCISCLVLSIDVFVKSFSTFLFFIS